MANEVFISYSRKDLERVKTVKEEIDSLVGINCWMDLDGIESGAQFENVIIDAICRHDTFLFMKSAHSMQSEWALDELDFAKHENKRIVLVHIDNSEMTRKFYFRYHKYDQIIWSESIQRDKLIKNLQTWYGKLARTDQRLHPVKIDNLYGLADDNQNVVVKGTWLSIGQFNDGIAFAQSIDRKYGMINYFGQVVVPYQWTHIEDFYEGIAKVQGEKKKYGFVNSKGDIISNCIWDYAEHFSDGLACVISAKESGFIDGTGKMVIPYNEGKMTSFTEGLACVSNKNGKWGYINKKGDVVIPYTWEKAGPFHTGLARVIIKDLYGYINKNGEYEIPPEWSDSELIPVQDPNTFLWGYINSKGKVMIPFEWVSVRPFSEGLARVEKNGVYGFIDRSGALVIPRRFLKAGDFKNGYAEIRDCVETRYNYVDKDGNLI